MKLIIEISDKMYKTLQDGTYCGSLYEELKNGIPVEPCGDCISREAALDDSGLGEFHRYDDYVKMRNYLKSLPSVTPQPKMGRWNFTKHYGRDYYVCSFCGMERMDDHSSGWNYCPFCGAKMQEVQDEDSD